MKIKKHDVVQFTEKHKWKGCLGIVSEVKKLGAGKLRYMIGVPVPSNDNETKTAYIFDDGSNIERIGIACLVNAED